MASTEYFADLEAFGSNNTAPSPGGTGHHTPRVSMSRRSSRRDAPTRDGSSSPPPMPSSSPQVPMSSSTGGSAAAHINPDDVANDDSISILDPRRFTPTLHASLVSEILNLRRELDTKHKFIEDLEISLQTARNEKDEVSEKLSQSDKDRRSLKRQFQQLENGTLAALEELAKDRDSTKASNVDLKGKLEEAQGKLRKKDEESEHTHTAWEKEKISWDTEKRGFERRVHITETRLKKVLAELEATHDAQARFQEQAAAAEGDEYDHAKDSGLGDESDSASQASPRRNISHGRNMSNSSRRSINRPYRFSVQSTFGPEGHKLNGVSLADELQLDEEEEEDGESDVEVEFGESEARARRSRNSHHDDKAKRILGIRPESRTALQPPIELDSAKPALDRDTPPRRHLEHVRQPLAPVVQYVDTGVQFTPPSSPKLAATQTIQPIAQYVDASIQYLPLSPKSVHEKTPGMGTAELARLQQRPSTPPSIMVDRGQQMTPTPSPKKSIMISAGSQTLDEPLSPPATPGVSPPSSPVVATSVRDLPALISTSTQTEVIDDFKFIRPSAIPSITLRRGAAPPPLPIPSIAIIPPKSAPASPKEPKLPPGTKSVSCQTELASPVPTKSISVQTEEILSDRRLAKLPPHLRPSTISSASPAADTAKVRASPGVKTPVAVLQTISEISKSRSSLLDEIPSSPPRLPSPPRKSPSIEQRYPGNNDNGPLNNTRSDGPRRPFRNASLFAGFDADGEEVERDAGGSSGADHFEEEGKTANFSTPSNRSMKHLRNFGGTRPSPVPEDQEVESKPRSVDGNAQQDQVASSSQSIPSARSSTDTRMSAEKARSGRSMASKSASSSRQPSIRRSAMIQSGTAAHSQRSRTPSIVSATSSFLSSKSAGPPFPVPDRNSSRKPFQSKSEGSQSPTPRTGGIFSSRRQLKRNLGRRDSLRKVRSDAAIQRPNSRNRPRSRSPPLDPHPLGDSFPPLPKDTVAAPQKIYASQRSGDKRLSVPLNPTVGPELNRASQGTVVDAIANTMVGEWMWKYVRRRKSFGVPESPQEQIGRPGTDGSVNVTGNGVRHKRWVWLSPYERAIMWSSKQPASNSALMGKSGRKLVIQSVLDVRDDTPLPKNHGISEPFNRSILILTPARALKFTATSRERHYTWLTALSFLAHSPLLAPGLAQPPEAPTELLAPTPVPPIPEAPRNKAPGLRRGQIRDSVRLAKDRSRPIRPSGDGAGRTIPELGSEVSLRPDAAEPPTIPRFGHGRKRSLTGPRLPQPPALRSLGYTQVPSPSFPMPSMPSPSIDLPSSRTSDASTSGRKNFFDAVGTIRMEAFIENQDLLLFRKGRARGNTNYSAASSDPRRSGVIYGDDFEVVSDPFKDFGDR